MRLLFIVGLIFFLLMVLRFAFYTPDRFEKILSLDELTEKTMQRVLPYNMDQPSYLVSDMIDESLKKLLLEKNEILYKKLSMKGIQAVPIEEMINSIFKQIEEEEIRKSKISLLKLIFSQKEPFGRELESIYKKFYDAGKLSVAIFKKQKEMRNELYANNLDVMIFEKIRLLFDDPKTKAMIDFFDNALKDDNQESRYNALNDFAKQHTAEITVLLKSIAPFGSISTSRDLTLMIISFELSFTYLVKGNIEVFEREYTRARNIYLKYIMT